MSLQTHLCLSLVVASTLYVTVEAQYRTGVVRGFVRDPQGGALAGADVDITCGGETHRLKTSASGEFLATALPLTRCAVSARSDAFETESASVDSRVVADTILVLQVRRFSSEVVVTPTRGVDSKSFSLPEALSITTRRDINSRPHTLLPQVLREEPGILLQQTTSAQISPIIRGFTGQSNVYLVDGVRLNTGQWRSGPSQYVSWIDGGPVDSIEVVRGGGSVQYGSDALGGTVQFLTTPTLFGGRSARISGNVEVSGASAAQSLSGQGDLAFQAAGSHVRVGASRHRIDDLRGGDGLDSHSAITRFLGLPSTLVGSRMPGTGFDQGGAYGLAAIGWRNGNMLRALYMHESQNGAARYDRILGGEGLYRSGFDPQILDFGMVRFSRADVSLVDGLSATFSINRQADGRFEQARPNARLDRQAATTVALGYQVQANRDFGTHHQLVVGGELYDESIEASRDLIDAGAGIQRARPDIPNGTSYRSYGVFAQHKVELTERLTVRGGARFSGFRFETVADAALGVTADRVDAHAMTFQAAAVTALAEGVNLTASVNRAFRAANAADFGSIGLTGGGGFEISPSTAAALGAFVGTTGATGAVSSGHPVRQLSPEVVYQYEVGVKASRGRLSAALNGFDLELFDFIQRRALVFDTSIVGTTISGFEVTRMDATGLAYIAQDVRPIATRVNVDRARVRGFDAEGEWRVTPEWTASSYFSVANGRVLPQGEYMRRMPPPMGGAKLRWSRDRFWAEGVVSYAAAQTRLNSGDISDARIGGLRTRASIATFFNGTASDLGLVRNGRLLATGETLADVQTRILGTATSAPLFISHPGFVVFGVRGGMRVSRSLDLSVLTENLTDVNYRLYGSGLDAPGLNVQVRARYRF
jgi:outer membrane receptor protein involved in Fe transport